jgi:hypothetical protein
MLERAALAVLDAVGQVPGLWDRYVVKGGLALRYAYGSPRETSDLDFNSVRAFAAAAPSAEPAGLLQTFCDELEEGLGRVAPKYGFDRLTVQFREFLNELPVIYVRVGYTHVPDREPPFDHYVELQATLSEMIRETRPAEVEGLPIRVPALEDILADKLKVLLQQPLRQTFRSADLFDLWYYADRFDGPLDPAKVGRFLREKVAPWQPTPPPTQASFRDPAVKAHVAANFDGVREQLPPPFPMPSVDEAYASVLRLVDALGLPER